MSPYDHPDYHALIRRIREIDRAPVNNDSTLARLVTADWLEERGEAERAEFIRRGEEAWSIKAGLSRPHQSSRYRNAVAAWLKVIDASRITLWVPGMSQSRAHPDGTCYSHNGITSDELRSTANWQGGFIGRTSCPLSWWLAHGPDLVRRHPVREVVVTGEPLAYDRRTAERFIAIHDMQAISRNPWRILAPYQLAERCGIGRDSHEAHLIRLIFIRAGSESGQMLPSYPTPEKAMSQFCRMCLQWAESEADRQPEGVELVPIQLTDADRILLASRQHTA